MSSDISAGPAAIWHAALAEGRLLVQRDPRTGRAIHPPRPMGGDAVEWIEASGAATLYSFTVITPRPPAAPYNVALVDLAEGVRVTTRIEAGEHGTITIGMPLKARIVREEQGALLIFDPA